MSPVPDRDFQHDLRGEQHLPDKKIIAVMGATGAQGGGLARAIAADPNGPFIARAITRKTDSDKALALARLGWKSWSETPTIRRASSGQRGTFH